MLNFFWWYSIIWVVISFLYWLGWSEFNHPLDAGLSVFILITVLISMVLGFIFRKAFRFRADKKIKVHDGWFVFVVVGAIVEFVIAMDVPLFSILTGSENYGDFQPVPLLHVAITVAGLYAVARYFYAAICNRKYTKRYLLYLAGILVVFALYYFRACIIISIFMMANMLISYWRSKGVKLWKLLISATVIVFGSLYLYGGAGNIRHGYSWNDGTYIERLGRYEKFPSFVPKQYMWSYSYLTSTLANLNNNIVMENTSVDVGGLVGELMPNAMAKRLNDDDGRMPYLEREYFNAVTGWCQVYMYFGYAGMYILFATIMIIGLYTVYAIKSGKHDVIVLCAILDVVFSFMFFYNTLNYVAISLAMWIGVYMVAANDYVKKIVKGLIHKAS